MVDYIQYYCRSWQYLYFEPRVVRFIRIVGTNNTVNKVFHVVSFEIMYTSKPFCLDQGLIGKKAGGEGVAKTLSTFSNI